MKYLDTILGWAGDLSANTDQEPVDKVKGLYLYADSLLQKRSSARIIKDKKMLNYGDIATALSGANPVLPEFIVRMENALLCTLKSIENDRKQPAPGKSSQGEMPFNNLESYFCIPENNALIRYRRRVEAGLGRI